MVSQTDPHSVSSVNMQCLFALDHAPVCAAAFRLHLCARRLDLPIHLDVAREAEVGAGGVARRLTRSDIRVYASPTTDLRYSQRNVTRHAFGV